MKFLIIGLEILAGIFLLIWIAAIVGKHRFNGKVHREVTEMLEPVRPLEPDIVTEDELHGLPAPVRRWLRFSKVIGNERIQSVRLRQQGEFRMDSDSRWMSFEAEQYYTTEPPGFLWYTTMKPAPLFHITGRDRYWRGHGNMLIKLLSVFPVVNASGPALDQGTLLRYLNEMMWFPSAALSRYIRWEAIDDSSARASMKYQGVTGTAVFYFNQTGEITNMVADRYRDANGRFELTRWSTPIKGYRDFGAMRIPDSGEGVWSLDDGDFSYIRLTITDIEYNTPALY